jgi:hypothetical protein
MSWRAQNRSKDAKTPSGSRGRSQKPELDCCPVQPWGMPLECPPLGLVAGTCSTNQANIGKSGSPPPNSCSVFVSGTCEMRVPICMRILCVMTPGSLVALWCKTAEGRGSKTRVKVAGYGGGMCGSRRMSGVCNPLTHLEAMGGCRVCEEGRVGSTKAVMGQVLGGGEMSSKRSKNAFVFDFLFAFGRSVGGTGWFGVWNRPPRPLNCAT